VSPLDEDLTAQLRGSDKIPSSPYASLIALQLSGSMMTSTPPSPAVTCAENIALLYLLHSVPDLPSRNPIDRSPVGPNGYTLSFLQERSLAGTLVFLSKLKDGPEHIPAVCVQEGPQSTFLNILLAVNEARPGDGNVTLQNLKVGFEKIFALLSRVHGQ
jgi:hypothetical protein